MKKTLLAAAVALAIALASASPSHAQYPVTDVALLIESTFAEYFRYAQTAYQIYQQLQSIYNQYQQINRQIQALKKLNVRSWRDIGPLYYQLNALLQESESLTYALDGLEERYYETFPGAVRYADFPSQSFLQINRALNTFRTNLLSLHQINEDQHGSLQILGEIQQHVDSAEGHEQTLEALAELQSWQADQQATMQATLESIANVSVVSASYQINQDAMYHQTETDTLAATLAAAQREANSPGSTYNLLPSWVPQQ
jgi:P-type conjugative transfer protein TrbJ